MGWALLFSRAIEACEDFDLIHPYIFSLTVHTESRVCVCSTCVAVFARCVVLSQGCGMIRAKSSTTQVCFICGVAGCEIRGWRSRSISNLLPRADIPLVAHNDLSAVWPDVIENSRLIFRDDTDPGLAELARLCKAWRVTWSELFVLCQVYYSGVWLYIGPTCTLEFQWVPDKCVCYISYSEYVDDAEFSE